MSGSAELAAVPHKLDQGIETVSQRFSHLRIIDAC